MTLFEIEAGTQGFVIRQGERFEEANLRPFVTQKQNLFGVEDIVIDPGRIHPPRWEVFSGHNVLAEGLYRKFYAAFLKDGWVLLVEAHAVNPLCAE